MTGLRSFLEGLQRLRNTGVALRYTTAVALILLALVLAAIIELVFLRTPTAPLFAAVLAAAWLIGFGPAIFAAAIGVLALDRINANSLGPWRIDTRDAAWLLPFFVIVLGMAWLASSVRRREDERLRLLARERKARAEAEAAGRAKDDFLAIVSHELRNPVAAVLGWVHLLRSGTLDPSKTEHAVETIHQSTVLQARLIDDLLDVSRAMVGKLDFVMEPVDTAQIVRQAVQSLQPKARAAGVTLEISNLPGHYVIGDGARLQQVVLNLLSNAIKFTPATGRVLVELRRGDGYGELVVRDSGQGIDAAALPHVFDRFYQGQSRLHGRTGLGLGLAIAKYIVELHGGSIAAESDGPGRGATFIVRLPTASRESGFGGRVMVER